MAASSVPINGTAIVIQISTDNGLTYDTIGEATSASLSTSESVRDITTKDSGGWREIAEGKREWSLAGEGLVTYSTAANVAKPNDLFDLLNGRTEIDIKFTRADGNAGDYEYSGKARLSSYEQDSGVEDNNTFSFSFDGSSTLSQAAIV